MRNLSTLDWVALVLLLVGGLNWGLVGFFGFNLVAAVLGDMTIASRLIYVLVGLSAIYVAVISPMLARQPTAEVHRPVHQAH